MDKYDKIYRKLNPPLFPHSPYGKRKELGDLWPVDQKKFRDMVDKVVELP